jgi:actin-like ATPase involved in cell morphogenesis
MPPPRATQVKGSSATRTGKLVSFETNVIKKMDFKGRDIAKGIPVGFEMTNTNVREAIQEPLLEHMIYLTQGKQASHYLNT